MSLEQLGFDLWFQQRLDPGKSSDFELARVVAVNKGNYIIRNHYGDITAEITGKLMFNAESPLDYPTVGDWVYAHYLDDNTYAIIDDILPRKTILKRKTAGKKVEFQSIAANIDTALIVQAVDHNYNLRRLERYLVLVSDSDIHPIILLSKCDLLSESDIKRKLSEVRAL